MLNACAGTGGNRNRADRLLQPLAAHEHALDDRLGPGDRLGGRREADAQQPAPAGQPQRAGMEEARVPADPGAAFRRLGAPFRIRIEQDLRRERAVRIGGCRGQVSQVETIRALVVNHEHSLTAVRNERVDRVDRQAAGPVEVRPVSSVLAKEPSVLATDE